MLEVSTCSNQLLHFTDANTAKIILWKESGAFDTLKLELIKVSQ